MLLIFIVDKIFLLYTIMLFIRILSSWLPEIQDQKWLLFIKFYTDPYLNLFRRFIPPLGMFDLSPIVAFIALSFLEKMVKNILIYLIV